VIFDANLTFDHLVRNTAKTFFISETLPNSALCWLSLWQKLINTFVFSRIDYCNALAGVSKAALSKLQLVHKKFFALASCLYWF